jgi:hypothetical protein
MQSLVGTMLNAKRKWLQSRAIASQFSGNKDTLLAVLLE